MKLALILLFASIPVVVSAAADLERGRTRSLACQACHGSAGLGTAPDIPNLAGQKPAYLATQLTAFRAGDRKHELMNAMAAQLSDADIADLAAFWSALPAEGSTVTSTAAQFRESRMTFPREFPRGFVMYKEEVDAPGKFATRSYANQAALAAARAGRVLPTGSVIVVENYSIKPGAGSGPPIPDKVQSYSAMESRSGWGAGLPELLRNGDWSYALFNGEKSLRADFNYARCLACHKPKADSSYVFGLDAITKTAKKGTVPLS
jgi:cytochrome c553